MVVVAFNSGPGVLETDVVKPGKRRSVDVSDAVIRDKKQLLCREGRRRKSGQSLVSACTLIRHIHYTLFTFS